MFIYTATKYRYFVTIVADIFVMCISNKNWFKALNRKDTVDEVDDDCNNKLQYAS